MIKIEEKDYLVVKKILRKYLSGEEVRAFGSRVSGKAYESSDLDLAICSQHPVPYLTLAKLEAEFSDSLLPFSVDVVDIQEVSLGFQKVIETDSQPLFY